MKILLIGPLPAPINGCSYANQVLIKNLKERNIPYNYINTNTDLISGQQGNRFSLKKAAFFTTTYLNIYKLFSVSVAYMTPGQTFFGMLKYSPFIVGCRILKKPYVLHLHGNYLGNEYARLKGAKRKIFHFLVAGASAGIVLSKSLHNNFKAFLPSSKIYVVENFVEHFLTESPLQKPTDHLRILYLSNLMREKGIFELLEALILLQKKNTKFYVTIAGAMETGIEEQFKEMASVLGQNIEYIGTVTGEDKRRAFNEANVFILPTYYTMEGQPICLLEGMATGNIIITTAHAGIPDIINQTNGFIVKQQSAAAITDCLEKIQLDLSSMVEAFAAHNKQYAAERFTEKIFINKIIDILYATAKT